MAGQYDHIAKRMRGSARGDQDGTSRAPRSQVGGNGRREQEPQKKEREHDSKALLLRLLNNHIVYSDCGVDTQLTSIHKHTSTISGGFMRPMSSGGF